VIERRLGKATLGFMAKPPKYRRLDTKSIFNHVEPEDLIKFGMIPEFVGRVPIVATLEPLEVEDLVKILTQPKNALVRQYQKLFEMEGVKLKFTKDAIMMIARQAIDRKLGARGLRLIMEDLMLDYLFDLPSQKNKDDMVITAEMIRNKSHRFEIPEEKAG